MRTSSAPGCAAATRSSASAFARPYSVTGAGASSSTYGAPLRPSKTTSVERWTSRAPTPRRRASDVLGAVDGDRPRIGAVLAVGGVDDHVRPHALEELAHGFGVADLDALGRRVGPQTDERRAEVAGRTRDVEAQACTLSGPQLRLARMRRTFLWINFVLSSLDRRRRLSCRST